MSGDWTATTGMMPKLISSSVAIRAARPLACRKKARNRTTPTAIVSRTGM
jgi:hypothetical protein